MAFYCLIKQNYILNFLIDRIFAKKLWFTFSFVFRYRLTLFFALRAGLSKKYARSTFIMIKFAIFFKIFRIFFFKIKYIFLINIFYFTLEKSKPKNSVVSFALLNKNVKKQIKHFFEHSILQKTNFIFNIFFLNYFVFCDIIRKVLQNKMNMQLVFTMLIKYFLSCNKNHLFFRFAWFFTDFYLASFEKYFKTLRNAFTFKSFSHWKRNNYAQLCSYFFYLYSFKKFKFLYIRCYTRAPNKLM
jgi:hypothetical protein